MNALDFALKALQALQSLPQLLQAGSEVVQLVEETRARLQSMRDEGRDPSPGEWDDLNARIDVLRGRLQSDDT